MSFHVDGPKTEKRRKARESGNSGESGAARNLQAESHMRGRAGSTGGCVKLKTVTEIRRSSARDIDIVEAYAIQNRQIYIYI